MTLDALEIQEASDRIFFETEASEGFLACLERDNVFDEESWHRLWEAVASLIRYQNGTLDLWATYDLSRVVAAVQERGQALVGRNYSSLTDQELAILEANIFINEIFGTG